VGDTTVFADYGPISGRRWRISADYSPDFKDGGTLTTDYLLDARQYIPVTRRSNFALRAYAAVSDGTFTQPTFVGGLDTIRGLRFRSEVGDRAFFANAEYRFPVIDVLQTPAFTLREVRGLVFFDIGGAYFSKLQDYNFYDSKTDRLQDGLSSYGFGVSAVIFGLPLNWDFAKLWDLKQTYTGFQTSFWIGTRF
jgi:outer membrane protein assembly factor BamA